LGPLIKKNCLLFSKINLRPCSSGSYLKLNRIVPLIGGHLAGANKLSNILAQRLNAIEFIPPATAKQKLYLLI